MAQTVRTSQEECGTSSSVDEIKRRIGSDPPSDGRSQDRESTCPISRNAALLEELDEAEGKVSELLEVAAEVLEELAKVGNLDRGKVDDASKKFLGLASEVHGCLAPKATLIRDYKPYPRSVYGPRKELELLHEKARFLRAELANMEKGQYLVPGPYGLAGSRTPAQVASERTDLNAMGVPAASMNLGLGT